MADPVQTSLARSTFERWVSYGRKFYDVVIAPVGIRTILLIGLALWLLSHDWVAAKSFSFNLGLVCGGLGILQWVRKLLMPYLDQKVLVEKAASEPLPAAIVYAATRAFDAAVLLFILFAGIR